MSSFFILSKGLNYRKLNAEINAYLNLEQRKISFSKKEIDMFSSKFETFEDIIFLFERCSDSYIDHIYVGNCLLIKNEDFMLRFIKDEKSKSSNHG
jgi:hypothetical protein